MNGKKLVYIGGYWSIYRLWGWPFSWEGETDDAGQSGNDWKRKVLENEKVGLVRTQREYAGLDEKRDTCSSSQL